MDEVGAAEFEALRSTIRERGTVRPAVAVATIGAWAALSVWLLTTATGLPVAALVPLIVLYAGFEAVAAMHIGVERIGRYLQVEHEHPGRPPRWETLAMAFSHPRGTVAVDPLFSVPFLSAVILNLLPTLGATLEEVLAVSAAHALVAARIFRVRRYAHRQRDLDLARFRELATAHPVTSGESSRRPKPR